MTAYFIHEMAEIAVNLLIDKLIPLLRDEVNLLRDVRSQVRSAIEQLQLIRAYLKDADAKAEAEKSNNLLKEWVTQMRQVSFRLEDVTDKYLLKMAKHPQRSGAIGILCQICGLLRTVKPWHEISSQIGEITESIERLNKARETYGFNPSAPESSSVGGAEISTRHYLRLGAHFIEDDQLVGVEHIKQVLTGWLLEGETSRTVISVVGEGGQGNVLLCMILERE